MSNQHLWARSLRPVHDGGQTRPSKWHALREPVPAPPAAEPATVEQAVCGMRRGVGGWDRYRRASYAHLCEGPDGETGADGMGDAHLCGLCLAKLGYRASVFVHAPIRFRAPLYRYPTGGDTEARRATADAAEAADADAGAGERG